jgi:aryl-alcohol dehydrogenase-like predicted oxidoreductase
VDCLERISVQTGKTIPQIAINWLLQQDTVSNIVIGARNEHQLIANLEASGWRLSDEHLMELNSVSTQIPIYPHWIGQR